MQTSRRSPLRVLASLCTAALTLMVAGAAMATPALSGGAQSFMLNRTLAASPNVGVARTFHVAGTLTEPISSAAGSVNRDLAGFGGANGDSFARGSGTDTNVADTADPAGK